MDCLAGIIGLSKRVTPIPSEQVEIRALIDDVLEQYKEAMTSNRCHWASHYCRGGTRILKEILADQGVETIAVSNQFHSYLIIENFENTGGILIIDPTIQQFAKGKNIPVIFVGNIEQFKEFVFDPRTKLVRDPRNFYEKFFHYFEYDIFND